MKKIALAITVSGLALATPAMAKEGFYMGLGLGYNSNEHSAGHLMTPPGAWLIPANLALVNSSPTDDISTDAFGAQIFAGYRMDLSDKVMMAIEADAAVFDGETEDRHTANYSGGASGAFTLVQQFSQQWMSSIRAKLGLNVTSDVTVYVTGGVAFSDVELRTTYSDTFPVVAQRILAQTGAASDLKTGFAYGGGVDWALGGSTSLRIEYMRTDLGNIETSRALNFSGGGPTGNTITANADLETTSIRVGLAWDLNL
jgi:opacity protein-like surface antigen